MLLLIYVEQLCSGTNRGTEKWQVICDPNKEVTYSKLLFSPSEPITFAASLVHGV